MRTETELTNFLATAAGWTLEDGGWFDGKRHRHFSKPPDFCHSVDACVKWLGPLFHYWEVTTVSTGFRAHLGTKTKVGLFSNIEVTPALAFARAAEQAMDAEKGVGGK